MFQKIKDLFSGKKTYINAIILLLASMGFLPASFELFGLIIDVKLAAGAMGLAALRAAVSKNGA